LAEVAVLAAMVVMAAISGSILQPMQRHTKICLRLKIRVDRVDSMATQEEEEAEETVAGEILRVTGEWMAAVVRQHLEFQPEVAETAKYLKNQPMSFTFTRLQEIKRKIRYKSIRNKSNFLSSEFF
jgi:hypothetical protein